jgi:uncharacterized protein YegP (UPF0339 family)
MRPRRKPWLVYAFEDVGDKWRVRIQAANGHITFTSGESYFDQWNAERAAEAVCGAYMVVGDSQPRTPEGN